MSLVGPPVEPQNAVGRNRLLWIILHALAEQPGLRNIDTVTIHDIAEILAERLHPRSHRRLGDRETMLALCDFKPNCWVCGFAIPMDAAADCPESFSLDHVIERSKGGARLGFKSLAPAHRFCNIVRSGPTARKRTLERYARFLERRMSLTCQASVTADR